MKRKRGRMHGAAMGVWLFFANLFDPAKLPATEQIADERARGGEAHRRAATAAGRTLR